MFSLYRIAKDAYEDELKLIELMNLTNWQGQNPFCLVNDHVGKQLFCHFNYYSSLCLPCLAFLFANFTDMKHYPLYTYSGANSCCNKALFMKQKCQHFQMRYMTLIYLKGLKSYQPPNFKGVVSVVKQTLHFYFNQ